jgi:signal transduction histidine kinase
MQTDYFALISKSGYHDIAINEIQNVRIGVAQGTIFASTFKQWFPNHEHTVEYENMDKAISALQRGEVDLVMTTQRRLLLLTHYQELPGYKANIIFDQPTEAKSGFNKDEVILCSIVDKALKIIDTKGISDRWMRRTYDYRVKVAETQVPWFIGAVVLSLCIVALIFILFQRGRQYGRQLEKQVSNRTAELNAVLDNYKGVIWSVDPEKNIITFGGQYLKKIGIPASALVGKNLEVARLKNRHLDIIERVEKTLKEGAQNWISEIDGGMFNSNTTPIYDSAGNVVGVVGSNDELTELITLQRNLENAVKEAQAANNAKSRFIANMSHEMRTPMNVIVGLTDLMLEEEDTPGNIKETLTKINTAGNSLMGLINDVLDISKVEAGKLELTPIEYDVPSLLNDIVTLNIIRIGEKPITFNLNINENLPCTLFGDDLRIKQVLNNLLSNSFKYTREGTVTLDKKKKKIEETVFLSFTINDTGIGIRKENLAKLFSDYNQVDTKANRKIQGTGLGLSITKRLVELMGGEISVESEYGKGTTFRVRICHGFVTSRAIVKEDVKNLSTFNYSGKKKNVHEKLVRPDLSFARVLVVDDFPTNLDVAAGMLRKYKMKVDCLLTGQDAVNRVEAEEPIYNAIFMDHMMPGMDGMEATALIRGIGTEYAKSIPIIALTANAVAGNEQMFLDNGFDAFLAKPINIMLLDSVVQRLVKDKSK